MAPYDMIIRALESNMFRYKNYDRMQGIYCLPRLSLGNHVGHSRAISEFIDNNQGLTFGILGMYKKEYIQTYSYFRNAFYIDSNDIRNNRLAGIRFDYFIIENALSNIRVNNTFDYELERMQSHAKHTTRLIALGN